MTHERLVELVYFREISAPLEVVEALRLRHRIYFEEHKYGPTKDLRLDLTAHDDRSRVFGVFQEHVLVGGVRLVFREEQPLAGWFRALRAVVGIEHRGNATSLPSEEAFDVSGQLGPELALLDAEIGRLALDSSAAAPWLIHRVMLATLAAVHWMGCRLYLYSCASTISKRYARVANPRMILEPQSPAGIASDAFVFPKPSVAAVAAVQESPFFPAIERYAAQLAHHGQIDLSVNVGRSHIAGDASTPSAGLTGSPL